MNRNRHRRPFTTTDIALASALHRCDCKPTLKRRHIRGVHHVSVFHDDMCPAADTPSMLLVKRGTHDSDEGWADVVLELMRGMKG